MTPRKPGTKFNVSRELRKNFNKFLTDYQVDNLTTEEYIKAHCERNHWIKSAFIINGREVIA